jgi:ankyrin repeat protein
MCDLYIVSYSVDIIYILSDRLPFPLSFFSISPSLAQHGWTCLHFAAYYGCSNEIFQILLKGGGDINSKDNVIPIIDS